MSGNDVSMEPRTRMGQARAWPMGLMLAAALLGSSCSCGDRPTTGQVSVFRPSLAKDPTGEADYLLDFGVVAIGDRKLEPITVENGGNTTLVVSGVKLVKPFSHDLPSGGLRIGVGASARIAFAFEPSEEVEEPSHTLVELSTNESGGRRYTVRLTGHGKRASLRCEPASLDFGPVPKGASRTRTTVCSNPLPIPIEIGAERFKGNNAASFSAVLAGAVDGRVRVPSLGEISVDVTFKAQAVGPNDATFELHDAFNQGLASVQLAAEVLDSTLRILPDTCLDFSYVGVGESDSKAFSLQTIGGTPLRVERISLPSEAEADFTILTATPIQLAADGATQELAIAFHPSTGGPHQVQLTLHTDDPRAEAQLVTACAKGFGGGPSIACTPASLDFGMVAMGMPVRRTVGCLNAGASVPGTAIDPLFIDDLTWSNESFSARIVNADRSEGPKRTGYALGESFTVEIEYAPTAERFDRGEIWIHTRSAPGGVHETIVSGQGRDLPPCDFTVEPPQLRFGIVDRGRTLTLPFGIRNHLDTSCLINDLRIAGGSDEAFSVSPIESVELPGHQTLEVEVTFAPNEYQSSLTGAVEFQISDPARMQQRVELRGSSQRPCIEIFPEELDFGKVSPGCASRELWVAVSNICGQPITVRSVGLGTALHSDAFLLRRRPVLPRTLHPHEREEFTMVFSPEVEGLHGGAIEVEVEGSEPYMARLKGEAVPNPTQTDLFDQMARPKVDILWVMDNSGSFSPYQERIAENLPAFLSAADNQNIDYHIAVTTSGLTPAGSCPGGANGGEDGRFFPVDGSHPRILAPTTPNLAVHWAHNMRVGTCHSTETYLEAAYRALSAPLITETKDSRYAASSPYNDGNAGFLRREASLSIIFVADEPDQSNTFGRTPTDYLSFFKGLKGANMFRAHGIIGSKQTQTSSCRLNDADQLHLLLDETEGTWLDICTPKDDSAAWALGLKKMSEGAFGFQARFILRGTPADANGDGKLDEDDIELFVDGHRQAPLTSTRQIRWTFDPISNAVDFSALFIPKAGSQISATYEVACNEP